MLDEVHHRTPGGRNRISVATADILESAPEQRDAWPGDDITAMTLIEQAGRFVSEMVTSARLNGYSRDEIARAIGTSPEETRMRSGPRWPCDF